MRAFHGKQEIKNHYLARVRAHREANELVRGQYWEKDKDGVFRGCAIGCTVHGDDLDAYESELGIPRVLAHLKERMFETIPPQEALSWPEAFLSAAAPGTDLSGVADHFMLWLMQSPLAASSTPKGIRDCLEKVAELYRRKITGDMVEKREWVLAEHGASTAYITYEVRADAAAYAAADAARAAAAYGATEAVPYAAAAAYQAVDYAAYKGAVAAPRVADSEAAWSGQSKKLLELIASAPVSRESPNAGHPGLTVHWQRVRSHFVFRPHAVAVR